MKFNIRFALKEDTVAVRQLLIECWHDTYDSIKGIDKVTEITDSWHSIDNLVSQIQSKNSYFLVAEIDETIAAHALANNRDKDVLLARLYVLPRFQRQGLGDQLLRHIQMRYPDKPITLSVQSENPKGLSFYIKNGFAVFDEKIEGGHKLFLMRKTPQP